MYDVGLAISHLTTTCDYTLGQEGNTRRGVYIVSESKIIMGGNLFKWYGQR